MKSTEDRLERWEKAKQAGWGDLWDWLKSKMIDI